MARNAVTGPTGCLGSVVIAGMPGFGIASDDSVAVARTPAKATALTKAGLQVRYGDYSKPVTLPAALDGAERLLRISGSEAGKRVAEHASVLDAAGVGHLEHTNLLRSGSTQPAIAPEHMAAEQAITQWNVRFTFLRSSFYTEICTPRSCRIPLGARSPISAASRAGHAAARVTALTQEATGMRYASWAVRHSPWTTSPERSRELPEPALSTGTSRQGNCGDMHRRP